ncbi:MAG TPA: glutamate racemase [Steroidobacteraceae bacterium]|nr:glutamate racemase [Steroidobacteraceae bacterium]
MSRSGEAGIPIGEAGIPIGEAGIPIGVFDSGVGGLTVLRALRSAMPAENFVYLGDTARLPYGTKSAETVVRYSLQCAAALIKRRIRALVVACNTASASALDTLRLQHPALPVIGVIEPGAEAAVAASRSQHIAVIATEGTISGGAYKTAIHRLSPSARVTSRACSLFVSMAEEGWTEGPIAEAVARRYLDPIFQAGDAPDTLVLGCTHFPALAAAIRAVLPPHVRIVDSAATTAAAVLGRLDGRAGAPGGRGAVSWLATDGAARFARVGSIFLGETLHAETVEIIDL